MILRRLLSNMIVATVPKAPNANQEPPLVSGFSWHLWKILALRKWNARFLVPAGTAIRGANGAG
jgi:hypothetical protein